MDLRDSDMGPKTIVTCDMAISYILQGIKGILSDGYMRHWHFVKSICDSKIPPVKGLPSRNGLRRSDRPKPSPQNHSAPPPPSLSLGLSRPKLGVSASARHHFTSVFKSALRRENKSGWKHHPTGPEVSLSSQTPAYHSTPNLGPWQGGPKCRVSNLRNGHVTCSLAIHVPCRL